VPRELQVAAEITLSQRCLNSLQLLEQAEEDLAARNEVLEELEMTTNEAHRLELTLEIPEGKKILERLTLRSLWHLLHNCPHDPTTGQYTKRLIDLGHLLDVGLMLDRCQELYYNWLKSHFQAELSQELRSLLQLGLDLAVDVRPWLQKLESQGS
jgi:hypothetical protein